MVYKKPSYEEYSKASEFARTRYRYGVYIQTIAVFLFLFLFFYTITNIEEMKANPVDYAENRMGVICNYPIIFHNVEPVEMNKLYLKENYSWEINFSNVKQNEISYIEIDGDDYYYIRDENNKLIVSSGERGYDWLVEKYK